MKFKKMIQKFLFLLLFLSYLTKTEAQNQFSDQSFSALQNKVETLGAELVDDTYFYPGDSSSSDRFVKEFKEFLCCPQSLSYNFKALPNFLNTIASADGKLKFIVFGYSPLRKPGTYSFIQYIKANGTPGSFFTDTNIADSSLGWISPYTVSRLPSKTLNLYIATYWYFTSTTKTNFGAMVLQLKNDSLITNYPALPDDKAFVGVNCEYSGIPLIDYEDKTAMLYLNLNECANNGAGELAGMGLTPTESSPVTFKFNGTKFVQQKK